ncbi:MAG: ABC transporter permease [Clostridiales bacterium]|nr:ABC transporter permease [Clostridiales bacterium]
MKTEKKPIQDSLYTLSQLVKRNLKLFFVDKAGVFFSMLAPLIVLLLYVLFLSDLQVNSVIGAVPEGIPLSKKAIQAYVDSWMIAGVLSITCITVSLGANTIMVADKTKGVLDDFISSPVKRWVITASYFLYNYITTIIISTITLIICLAYLALSGGWHLSITDVLFTFTTILLSALSATLITVFISGFIRTEAALSGLIGIISAVIGFFIGAYMPMSIMPKALQYIASLLPGTYSAGLFRNYLMTGALNNFGQGMPKEVVDTLADIFSMRINLFGKNAGKGIMYIFLSASVFIFSLLSYFISFKKKSK